ncbi:MAG: Gfo/Idh/MocA family oxidoreductase, partial [Candidatus Omnitrophica bacterium]|nr:Gfo/Idh/MocA family oxidoreductase [Candidatus Omnitrophota bacterium]
MKAPVRVGVVGVGHVGALHAHVYAKLRGLASLVAVCDINPARAREVAGRFHCLAVSDAHELIGRIDAVSIAVPTSLHHAVGTTLLQAGIHTLVEKPIATTLAEADALRRLATQQRVILQVGHIERFNAAIRTAEAYLTHPRFIEAHRLSPYPFRGTDVSVVLDVMIHDLDLVLALVQSQPTRIDAVGVPVLSSSEDIANARLIFPSGCVANLTASRVSDEAMRRIRVFQEDCYLSIDYQQQVVELARKTGRNIRRRQLPVTRRLPLDEELTAFLRAIRTARRPLVSGEEAREALALALAIERAMRRGKPTAVH